jgi:hypothetical protein
MQQTVWDFLKDCADESGFFTGHDIPCEHADDIMGELIDGKIIRLEEDRDDIGCGFMIAEENTVASMIQLLKTLHFTKRNLNPEDEIDDEVDLSKPYVYCWKTLDETSKPFEIRGFKDADMQEYLSVVEFSELEALTGCNTFDDVVREVCAHYQLPEL